jgi:glutamate-1-semialdehyde 2,1-aminomutase
LFAKFFHALLSGGVAIAPGAYEALFVGLAHTDVVMNELADRVASALKGFTL